MRLPRTPEMAELWKNIKPYFAGCSGLKEDAPESAKKDFEEYLRLAKKQTDFAYSLM